MKKFNMNENVYVQLTEHAMTILEKNLSECCLPENIEELARARWKPDRHGFVTFQTWEICQEFGKHMYNGSKQLFIGNVIRIPDRSLHDV